MQALQAATLNPARFLGMEKDPGRIEEGKLADLVLFDANPLADIRNTQKVDHPFRETSLSTTHIAAMLPSISEVYEGISSSDDPPASCCTLEATTLLGSQVWIQALPGTVNMAYPFTDEPFDLLHKQGVRSPSNIYLVEWVAGEYATFGFGNISARDHAFFLDQLFVKVLGCDDARYQLKISIEPLET